MFIRVSGDLSKKSGPAMHGMVTRLRPALDNREDAEKTLEAC